MNYFLLLISIWTILGEIILLKPKIVQLKKMKIFKGLIKDLHKKKEKNGTYNYYDVIEYFDKKTQELIQIEIVNGPTSTITDLIFPYIKTTLSTSKHNVWVIIKENGDAEYLSSMIFKLLFLAGLLILGVIFLLISFGIFEIQLEKTVYL